ncbi:MAG TPA: hypothetical protein VK698_22655 [Kofleriaceae bacterium]|nr:hypothetical protein [Kofleriaceae bacterium]
MTEAQLLTLRRSALLVGEAAEALLEDLAGDLGALVARIEDETGEARRWVSPCPR